MAKRLVFLYKQVTVRYTRETDAECGQDRVLFTVVCFVNYHAGLIGKAITLNLINGISTNCAICKAPLRYAVLTKMCYLFT